MMFLVKMHFHALDSCEVENNSNQKKRKTSDFIEACLALALNPAAPQLRDLEQVGCGYLCRFSGSWAVKGETFQPPHRVIMEFRHITLKTLRPRSGVL